MNKKNIIITIISVLILVCIFAFARTTTTDLGLVKPTWDESVDILTDINANSDILEAFANDVLEFDLSPILRANLDIATFNIEGVDATEFGYVDGVTSDIQTQFGLRYLKTEMDSFSEIQAIISDKTLINEEDVFTIDANWVNIANPWADNEVSDTLTCSDLVAGSSVVADSEVDNDITIDLATLATTFTCTDNESEALACPLVFVDGATGAQGAETDGDLTYNPSTGKITATGFVGALTGNADTVTTNANLTGIVTSTGNATAIANKAIAIAKLADGTDGELITWDASGIIATVPVGTATHVLTSGGAGVAPTFQVAGGGYTNLTSFVDQTAWRVFYSNAAGDVTELALGADGTYLKSNGAAAAPSFSTPAGAGDALTANPLSQFAATTSAELAGVISDEIGAGKARFDTSVTAKTTTATLNVNEAGTILCSAAGGAYTITLPTASGNTGLTYHFIKTDANYTLITLDGNGAETFNYENATSAPVTTYPRLNTYCAEVTVVSDGSNWQVIDEAMGQVPTARVYLGREQEDIPDNAVMLINVDTEDFDIGGNFDLSTWISGSADGTVSNHLQDDNNSQFTEDMIGYEVKNTTDSTYAWITTFNDAGDVTIDKNIFVSGEGYEIKNTKFVAPIPGKYYIQGQGYFGGQPIDGSKDICILSKNGVTISNGINHASINKTLTATTMGDFSLSIDDEITLRMVVESGATTTHVDNGTDRTFILIRLVSKD